MTGGKRVVVSNPKTYHNESSSKEYSESSSNDGGDGSGFFGVLILAGLYFFWKYILVIGIIFGLVWIVYKMYLNRGY